MGFYEELIAGLKESIERDFDGKISRLAAKAETHTSTLSRLVTGERKEWLSLLARVADAADLTVISRKSFVKESPLLPSAKEVCWIDAQVVPNGEVEGLPAAEGFLAVPMVEGQAAAGRGKDIQEGIKGWVLVRRQNISACHRNTLLAIQISDDGDSMEPTLRPGDIVLYDTNPDNFRFRQPGNIHVVMEPDGSVAIKRIAVKQSADDTQLIFYSDNATMHPPLCFSLNMDYEGEITKAVLGRVVWAWSDLHMK